MDVTIDRFEGSFAVVELPNKQCINVPRELFVDAKEGEVFTISKGLDGTADRTKRIRNKFDSLRKD